jgi:hypothetical protein
MLVAVRLGQGREAGDVGEDKGGIRHGQSVRIGAGVGAGVLISLVGLAVEVNARDYLDDDDRRGHPVDDKAEGRPPAGVRNELAAVLPEILEAVGAAVSSHQKASGDAAWIPPKTSPHSAGVRTGRLFATGSSRVAGARTCRWITASARR